MCHKKRKMGTMVERIQPVSTANFLDNMVKIFANTSNALTPGHLRTKLQFLRVGILNWKRASPYPQLERGRSISLTGKGPCKQRGLGLCFKSGPKRSPAR